ncbi:MAG: tripartite tricarboxylate transporter substrate binding protein [Rhizobacter sp.]|nr:tripartite tricarboxylate transporter substrate binding protein [Rhizobacter sp.]
MNADRRLILSAAVAACIPASVRAAAYPSRPVRFFVPFAAGGGSDTFSRLIAQQLSDKFGYTVLVENRPGAGGNLGAEAALREPADGYTLLVISGSYAGNAILNKPAFDSLAAIRPIVQFTREPVVLAVGPASPFQSLADLIAAAKKDPGGVTYGSSGVGGLAHLSTEYFASVAGIKLNHVPYKGTAASLVDLAGGQIQFILVGTSAVASLTKGGKVRPLAVGAPARLPSMPNIPTFSEQGLQGFQADLWHGLVAPKGVPDAVVSKLNAEINTILKSPDMLARFKLDDVAAAGGTPEQFGAVIRSDMERWKVIVRDANIRLS